jgi:hypothetical protein
MEDGASNFGVSSCLLLFDGELNDQVEAAAAADDDDKHVLKCHEILSRQFSFPTIHEQVTSSEIKDPSIRII